MTFPAGSFLPTLGELIGWSTDRLSDLSPFLKRTIRSFISRGKERGGEGRGRRPHPFPFPVNSFGRSQEEGPGTPELQWERGCSLEFGFVASSSKLPGTPLEIKRPWGRREGAAAPQKLNRAQERPLLSVAGEEKGQHGPPGVAAFWRVRSGARYRSGFRGVVCFRQEEKVREDSLACCLVALGFS